VRTSCSFRDTNSRGRSRFTCRRAFHCSPSRVSIPRSFIQPAGNGTAENARPRAAMDARFRCEEGEIAKNSLAASLLSHCSLFSLHPSGASRAVPIRTAIALSADRFPVCPRAVFFNMFSWLEIMRGQDVRSGNILGTIAHPRARVFA
jgi:hypothetical protein